MPISYIDRYVCLVLSRKNRNPHLWYMMKVWTEEEGCHILNAKFDFDTLMNTDVIHCEDRETDSTQTDGVRRGYVLIILIFKCTKKASE